MRKQKGTAGRNPLHPGRGEGIAAPGILTIAISVGCAALGGIAEGVVAGFMNIEQAAVTDLYLDNEANIALGVMFMVLSLLCRYGAELTHGDEAHG